MIRVAATHRYEAPTGIGAFTFSTLHPYPVTAQLAYH
jgi:hypothetical protein